MLALLEAALSLERGHVCLVVAFDVIILTIFTWGSLQSSPFCTANIGLGNTYVVDTFLFIVDVPLPSHEAP